MDINYLDLILLLPIIWAAYKGFKKGLVLEIASIVGLICGLYAGIKFSDYVGSKLDPYFEVSQQWLSILSFIITFIAVVALVHLLGKIIERTIKLIALGFANRIGGSLFSVLKTSLIISFVLFLFNQVDVVFSILSAETKENSLLYMPLQKIAPNILPIIEDLEIPKLDQANDSTSV